MPAKDELREVGPAIVATVVAAIGVFFLSAERVEFDWFVQPNWWVIGPKYCKGDYATARSARGWEYGTAASLSRGALAGDQAKSPILF
jgi:hypothetical protein